MDKPKPEDFSLSVPLIKEITSYNRSRYKAAWVLTHVLSIGIALILSIVVRTSSSNKLIIFAGIIVALYSLRYLYGVRLITAMFIKPHPLSPRLTKYAQAYKSYLASHDQGPQEIKK